MLRSSHILFGLVSSPAARRRLRLAACAALAGLLSTQAQAQDSTLTRLVHKYQYDLVQNGNQFSGPGWEKLQQDIQQSTLVLIGEGHGMAQVPQFTAAVAAVLKPKVYVAEIDKYQARYLSRMADQPGLPTAFMRQHPNGLSFYSWAEEFELARTLRAQRAAIVGIDQVSLTATGTFFGTLADQVKNRRTRAYLLGRAAAYQAQDRAIMKGDTGQYSLFVQRPSALDSLRLLTRRESPVARQMVEDFAASAEIYRLFSVSGVRSHAMRVGLMKRNLLTELQPYQPTGQPLPPMLFKFGAVHAGRGISVLGDYYDVGNMALNLADVHDQKSLHIFIIGKQGTQVGGFDPDDFAKNVAPYSADPQSPFVAATPAGAAWQVFDLRPLRRALLRDKLTVSNAELEATILGYDYVVIIPETTASRNF
ncbi:hypothetical protein [Hymenobacter terrestris]|uniref:Haem-binding uptake Tiki superfamily ChaN domain-containing protein n=1 Tax=Hymenobacter terrestris TaxID=2748310 RepID=A0ABX2Q289_9BACT|nr:hypothetical protein [Hymenobacter terrestris]NVO84392.1 hypothetical protein [Hymenobacter terrestris]